MLKLDQMGHAYEAVEYDQDHSHDYKPLTSVGYQRNVVFQNPRQAIVPQKRSMVPKSIYIGRDFARESEKARFSKNVYKEQSLGFSGTNYEALEAALLQSYEHNPESAYVQAVHDYPTYIDKHYNMAFNGERKTMGNMGLDLSIDWQGLLDSAESGIQTGIETGAGQLVKNLIPGSGGGTTTIVQPGTTTIVKAPSTAMSSTTKTMLIVGGVLVLGLVAFLALRK